MAIILRILDVKEHIFNKVYCCMYCREPIEELTWAKNLQANMPEFFNWIYNLIRDNHSHKSKDLKKVLLAFICCDCLTDIELSIEIEKVIEI